MALRNQPYLPLYVNDFLTDEKLAMCSAESTGVYIRLMCLMHKSETYGSILLKQIEKQNASNIENFACRFAKQMPYSKDTIYESLSELIAWGVLQIDGDTLFQKRMKKDGELSDKRAFAGSLGGKCSKSQNGEPEFCSSKNASKIEANTEIEIEYINEDVSSSEVTGKGVKGENPDKPKKKVFTPPTLEEITAYCKERGNDVDPKKFYDYFTAAEWVDGRGNPVKNWKQKVITWESHGGTPQRAQSPSHIQTAAEYAASKPTYKSDLASIQRKIKKVEG